jgi:hypothetical protein
VEDLKWEKCLILALVMFGLSAQAKEEKARKPASSCPVFYGAETSLEQAFENQKSVVEKNGLILSNCTAIAKDVVDADAKDGISDGRQTVIVRGVRTSSVYSCKTSKKFQAFFRVFRFQPIEDTRYNGFNVVSGDCSAPTGEFVAADMTMLSK